MSREGILGAIRAALGREADDADRLEAARARLEAGPAAPPGHVVPARGRLAAPERQALFLALAERNAATLDVVARAEDVPRAIADYLAGRNLSADLVLAPDPWLLALPWDEHPLLRRRSGAARIDDAVSVTPVFAAIAETGTLMLRTGPDLPLGLAFVPETHIAILRAPHICGTYEEAWARLRARGESQSGTDWMPSGVSFVSGPSRTADIEQTMYMGAHGPKHLHILLVEEEDG